MFCEVNKGHTPNPSQEGKYIAYLFSVLCFNF